MTKRRDAKPAARSGPLKLGLPSKDDILRFIETSHETVGKREITRAFGIKGGDRIALKALLQEMTDDGLLSGNRKGLKPPGKLPATGVFDIIARDADGDLVAEPVEWPEEGARPRVLVAEANERRRREHGALGVSDRILARTERLDGDGKYSHAVTVLKKLQKEKARALGILRAEARGGFRIDPIEKREMRTFRVGVDRQAAAKDGDLVRSISRAAAGSDRPRRWSSTCSAIRRTSARSASLPSMPTASLTSFRRAHWRKWRSCRASRMRRSTTGAICR